MYDRENGLIGAGFASNQAMQMQNALGTVPTIQQRIALAVQQAEERLAAVKRAQELFEKNPDLEELLNIMQRAHF